MTITRRLVVPVTVATVLAGAAVSLPTAAGADPAPPGGSFVAVAPTRVLDTRLTAPGDKARDVVFSPAAALTGVDPTTVADVLVNVTVVGALGTGYVVVGAGRGTSNGNFAAIRPSATLALVADPGAGSVPIHLSTDADVVVDVQGYVTTTAAATSASFTPLAAPVRVADSRKGLGLQPFGTGQTQTLPVAAPADLPEDATAVVANVTVASAAADTYVTAWSGQGARPTVSTVNAPFGGIVANRAVVPIGPDGSISLFNYAKRTDVVVDVVGYLSPDAGGSYYSALTPYRLVDTRTSGITLPALGDAARPKAAETALTAYWVTVVGDQPAGPGYIAVRPNGTPPTGTSDLNLVPRRAVSNAGPAAVGDDSSFFVASVPTSRVVVDVSGYFLAPVATPGR